MEDLFPVLLIVGLIAVCGLIVSQRDEFGEASSAILKYLLLAIRKRILPHIDDPYSNFNPNYYTSFGIDRSFTIKSPQGFKIRYELDLICHRRDDVEFKNSRMLEESVQQKLAEEYNEAVFLAHFRTKKYFFTFDWQRPWLGEWSEIVRTPVVEMLEQTEELMLREVLNTSLNVQLHPMMFAKNGCETQLGYFRNHIFPDELVEENYAMLNDGDKKNIEADDSYGPLVEMIAVAALKRRLDFIGRQSRQNHETERLSIVTERAGRAVRIAWNLKMHASYELLGFRSTDGFYSDQFDESRNGKQVIHSVQNQGGVIESLRDGETYFYTLFLRSERQQADGSYYKCSPLRFQISVGSKEEMDAIQTAIERSEGRKPPIDPGRLNMSHALKELGLVMEFDEAIDEMEKSLIDRIKSKKLPKHEEKAKIEFVQDTARIQRDKYMF